MKYLILAMALIFMSPTEICDIAVRNCKNDCLIWETTAEGAKSCYILCELFRNQCLERE